MVDHSPTFAAPWYADQADGTMIHRYLNDEFMDNFLREATQNLLQPNAYQTWLQEDKFGGDTVKLRLPIHRTFYTTATELVCDTITHPAFSPKKIVSAGFVIRKRVDQSFHIWRIKNGVALGWQLPDVTQLDKDPDLRNQIKNKKIFGVSTSAQSVVQSYSGEQTYPLHVQVVSGVDATQRNHTLLYGYVPLNGNATGVEVNAQSSSSNNGNTNAATQQVSAAGYLAELEWPFGSWDGVSTTPVCNCSGTLQDIIQKMCDAFSWSDAIEAQVIQQAPTRAFSTWLAMLLHRYQVTDISADANQTLISILKSIPIFSQALSSDEQTTLRNASALAQWPNTQIQGTAMSSLPNLFSYLQDNAEAISNWYSQQDQKFAQGSANTKPALWDWLPGYIPYVYIFQSQAEQIRAAMLLRAEAMNQTVEAVLPLPRYTQGKNDLYFICPFVRYLDECGCEKVLWGNESMNFKVASMFDPQATRPSVIQLPELSDIKKGFANGVTFLTPKSLSDAMLNIVPTMDMKTKNQQSPLDACLGFSISFSIPIITICAMILLMIVLNLLNLIFRWLPFAILVLPRLCMPKVEIK